MSVRLSQDEAWEVLEHSHTGILTTLKADGAPVTLPVWFVVVDRTIGMMAPSRTKKVSRIRRDPRASFLVESGQRWAELRAVHLSGSVEELGGRSDQGSDRCSAGPEVRGVPHGAVGHAERDPGPLRQPGVSPVCA